MAGNLGS